MAEAQYPLVCVRLVYHAGTQSLQRDTHLNTEQCEHCACAVMVHAGRALRLCGKPCARRSKQPVLRRKEVGKVPLAHALAKPPLLTHSQSPSLAATVRTCRNPSAHSLAEPLAGSHAAQAHQHPLLAHPLANPPLLTHLQISSLAASWRTHASRAAMVGAEDSSVLGLALGRGAGAAGHTYRARLAYSTLGGSAEGVYRHAGGLAPSYSGWNCRRTLVQQAALIPAPRAFDNDFPPISEM